MQHLRKTLLLSLLLLVAACAETQDAPDVVIDTTGVDTSTTAPGGTGEPDWSVTRTTFGSLRIGMTRTEASSALGEDVTFLEPQASPGCAHAMPGSLPPGTALMFIEEELARFEVDTTTVHTDRGAGVGDTEDQIKELYGDVEVQPHKYTDGHYLIFAPDTTHAIIFETDGTRVTRYRAGRYPEVSYIEGCS